MKKMSDTKRAILAIVNRTYRRTFTILKREPSLPSFAGYETSG